MAFLRMLRGNYQFQGVNFAAIFDDPLMIRMGRLL